MLSKFSVKKPYTVIVGLVLIVVLGIVSFQRMTTDLLPDINLPYAIVITAYPGASPSQVEEAVTKPVEQSMATVSNIKKVQSVSQENMSMVILEFAQTTDMDSVSLEMRELLDQIGSYWDDSVGNPIIMKVNPEMMPVMVAAGIVVALVAAARRRPTLAGRALGAVIGANITTQILKDYILTRPNLGVTTGAGNSLPSGHTTVAVTLSLALIVVAPQWFRSPSAWIGWAWTSLMGVSVMMEGWHRPSDVITAALIAGAWALALSPIERRPRHGAKVQRVMMWASLGLIVIALLATGAAMWGFSMSAASPGSGYGFEDFLQVRPWRSRVLGVAAVAWVSAVCGLIMHEVDRLAGE